MNLTKKFNRLVSGDSSAVFKGMATLALGSGGARLIGIAAIPVLTRLYSPEDFGVLAVFAALVAIAAPLMTLRYVLALPLPRRDGTALNLLALAIGLMLVGTVLTTLIFGVFGRELLSALSMEALIPWWWLIGVGVLAASSYELMTYWATRRRAYKIIAKTNVWQSASGSIVKVGLGMMSLTPLGLLLGDVVAKGGGLARLIREFMTDLKKMPGSVSWYRVRKVGHFYRDFPYFRVPSQFLMVFSQQIPLLFSAAVYGPETTGQLSLALMALALPVTLVGGTMGKALYAEAASIGMRQPDKIYRITKDVQRKLLVFAIPVGALLFAFGEQAFVLFFGDEWKQAGMYASILCVYMVFLFTSGPLVQLLNVVASQTTFLAINIIRTFIMIVLFSIIYIGGLGDYVFVVSYSLVMSLFYLFVSFFVFLSVRRSANARIN
ncbi:MAG: oligosaccharide flippase family protein [Polycyclovorans sp.]|nr:oligosaccharide flippase family protein [Polycyclovorans sp.]